MYTTRAMKMTGKLFYFYPYISNSGHVLSYHYVILFPQSLLDVSSLL